jgi:pimeloyl-ACP methyl ester carboxylesterase
MAARERIRKELPDPPTGFEIHPGDCAAELRALGVRIADAVDTRLAEHAYAAEALIAAINDMHPELIDRPVVVIGFSAGALAAPAVAARLHEAFPERPLRLVLVGGGGDLLTMARTSTLTNGGITLRPADGPDPTPEQIEILQSAYEARVRLDPVKSVAALRAIPMLHVYASNDTIVPTAGAERVNAAHAGNARLIHRGDHDTLFFFLGSQAGPVRSWLRSTGVE